MYTQQDDIDGEDEDDQLLQDTPNLFLRQASSGAQVQFSDNEEVCGIIWLIFHCVLIGS